MSVQTDLWVDWDEYHLLIEKLALQIDASGWEFDRIVAVARGGLRVGDILSRLFQLPLDIMSASSYRGNAGTVQEELVLSSSLAGTQGDLAGRVLLVDDLADTGHTFVALVEALKQRYTGVTELRSACLWCKKHSLIRPDFIVADLAGSPWIHQPFERYDNIRLEDLRLEKQKS